MATVNSKLKKEEMIKQIEEFGGKKAKDFAEELQVLLKK
jgi:hypothetical protein